jgi:hypothetical protein
MADLLPPGIRGHAAQLQMDEHKFVCTYDSALFYS